CCVDFFETTGYIPLETLEIKSMEKLGLPVVSWQGQKYLATRPHEGVGGNSCCVAFVGTVGQSCACSIHPERPSACRKFQAGSDGCLFARQASGL
ncbi:MAG: hypothetical protein ACKO23_15700, partial [Gemmataceae bacterium]